jgi:hypothetical protein
LRKPEGDVGGCEMGDVVMEDLSTELDSSNDHGGNKKTSETFSTIVFAWGNTVDGELGLGGLEEEFICQPTQLSFPAGTARITFSMDPYN